MMDEMAVWMWLGLLVVGLVIGVTIYLAVRAGTGGGQSEGRPRAILRERLASGEISAEEYREREAALARQHSRPDRDDGRDA